MFLRLIDMTYNDIKERRHNLLWQRAQIDRQLRELDAPLIEQMAASEDYRHWHDPKGGAELDLKKMHKKHDPKL